MPVTTEKNRFQVKFSYLDRQFADVDRYLADVKALVQSGDFTLGRSVEEFERRFAEVVGVPYAVGVGSGTDALTLPLKLLGVGPGDEVITPTNTFVASVGAIAATGATPVFVDNEDGFVIDPEKIEAAVTPRTKAILPVHYTGNVADMPNVMATAKKHRLIVVEDACQAIMATINDTPVGSWGAAAGFSLHPLKNLNVWGDGGVVVTTSSDLAGRLRRYRNHGMLNRDEYAEYGVNSRLDSLHAVIGNRLVAEVHDITNARIRNAGRFDEAFANIGDNVRVPRRRLGIKHVYHLYMLRVARRDELLDFLHDRGIEAKVHYPIPMHLQQCSSHLGYKRGDFPVAEEDSRQIITLPAHQHLTSEEIDYTVEQVQNFYKTH